MRLTQQQQDSVHTVLGDVLGEADYRVSVFGSRANDCARGGDVDLLVEVDQVVPLMLKARINHRLQERLGLPVDIVFFQRGEAATAFQNIALKSAELIARPQGK